MVRHRFNCAVFIRYIERHVIFIKTAELPPDTLCRLWDRTPIRSLSELPVWYTASLSYGLRSQNTQYVITRTVLTSAQYVQ